MSTLHLSIRVGEHLGIYLKTESSVKDDIMSRDICANSKFNVNSFKIIKKCNSNFETKIQEALLIKKHNPDLIDIYWQMHHCFVKYILNWYFCYLDFTWCICFTFVVLCSFCACIFKSILNNLFSENLVRQIY